MATFARISLFAAALLAATALVGSLVGVGPWGIDDAYIFFVYADHAASGQGFVYNLGSERVEGFSSFLWQVLLTGLFGLGLTSPLVLAVISALLTALTVICALDIARLIIAGDEAGNDRVLPLTVADIFCVAWVFAYPGWLMWTISSLMDSALWIALLTVTLWWLCRLAYADTVQTRDLSVFSVLVMLGVLARPEYLAWGPFFVVSLFLLLRWKTPSRAHRAAMPATAFAVSLVGLTAFRYLYFGYPLPNTYYAKVSPDLAYSVSEGAKYVGTFLSGGGFGALAVLAALGILAFNLPAIFRLVGRGEGVREPAHFVAVLTAGFVACNLIVAVLEGGDHFGSWRLLMPSIAVLPVFVLAGVRVYRPALMPRMSLSISGWRVPVFMIAAIAILTLPVRGSWFNPDRTGLKVEFEVAQQGIATAKFLLARLPDTEPKPAVGVTAAGGFAQAWDGPVVDLMGLNLLAMAHSPGNRYGFKGHAAFNADVFYAQNPELVLPQITGWPKAFPGCEALQEDDAFLNRVLNGLLTDADFRQVYDYVEVNEAERDFCAYVRKDYLQQHCQVFDACPADI